jgi:hypothetical protein
MRPKINPSLTMLGDEEGVIIGHLRASTWIRAPKTAFASARMKSGPHMVACTAKPISIGLQPSEKSWRHQRLRSPVNRPRKRSDGHLYVLRLPERSRWPANAARHPEMLTASAAAIRALSGCHGLGM